MKYSSLGGVWRERERAFIISFAGVDVGRRSEGVDVTSFVAECASRGDLLQ